MDLGHNGRTSRSCSNVLATLSEAVEEGHEDVRLSHKVVNLNRGGSGLILARGKEVGEVSTQDDPMLGINNKEISVALREKVVTTETTLNKASHVAVRVVELVVRPMLKECNVRVHPLSISGNILKKIGKHHETMKGVSRRGVKLKKKYTKQLCQPVLPRMIATFPFELDTA
ncbi:hypothetical protein V6N13_097776 [Hibiscus sabdariffa]|uniref:Uncharacterized protein n=2 Tax=Hibiscus sabdariffa TaxID=183260 RepID=A0ABR1ZM97_9ROSI